MDVEKRATICPKCGRPAWAPYVMSVTKKYGQVYHYNVYRHPDRRRRSPKRCTAKVEEGLSTNSELKTLNESKKAAHRAA
jgi:hypothetical protein